MKLGEIGEFGFIQRVAPLCLNRTDGVHKGIGDDCAVIDVNCDEFMLITTDLLLERVHFNLAWTSAEDLGAKSLAVNLSDIAACGGTPRDAFISIAIPPGIELDWLDNFYRGLSELAKLHRVNILGGDTSLSKSDLMISLTLTGIVPKSQVLLRSGASPGDLVCLIGNLGESAAGLNLLKSHPKIFTQDQTYLLQAHLRPKPLVHEGRLLAESGYCMALIDISDGLSSDLGHLCKQSEVGATIDETLIPISKNLLDASEMDLDEIRLLVMNGGEDYALLAAIRPEGVPELQLSLSASGSSLSVIGQFTSQLELRIRKSNGQDEPFIPKGWNHFKQV